MFDLAKLEEKKRRRGLSADDLKAVEGECEALAKRYGLGTPELQSAVDVALARQDRDTFRRLTDEYNHWHRVSRLLDLH